jgi:hypothetical protein
MHYVVLVAMVIVMFATSLANNGYAPGSVKYLPEAVTAVVMLCVLLAGVRQRFRLVGARYWLVFAAMAVALVGGIAVNSLGTGPIIAALRFYLRAIPFFFIPAVFQFDERQLKQQMKLLLALSLVQVPLAIYQRWVYIKLGWATGDFVFGTLQDSGVLSIFLISVAIVLTSLMLRGRLNKLLFALLFFVILVPTMINETKITVVLLPLGLFVTLLVGAPPGRRLVLTIWAVAILGGFGAIFVPVYDYLNKDREYAKSLTEFFSDEKEVSKYVATGESEGSNKPAGRVDAVVVPFRYISRDPSRLVFGLGMGNASRSSLGVGFSGKYFLLFKSFTTTSAGIFLLEIGTLGLGLALLLQWLIFRDALALARSGTGLESAIAAGWAAVVVMVTVGMFYAPLQMFESVSYLFWYYSGLIAATRLRLALRRSPAAAVRAPRPIGLLDASHSR